ncbi:ulp1 protease family, C-terminal catalytic domain-containing protein [Artemisia annua]|uniref:Ulp1 protease family, C-terminal catalytic domain-containing protein n=1 Tax=Artemisia annua TaxID=35608 RepID=A0A2U1LXM2_ARTAN|nr:ulp1 protease family, C-terminal catalytic domain-containing protein [Artemisia annua]
MPFVKEHMEEDMEEEVVKEPMEEDVEEDTDKKNTEEDADSPNDLTDFKFFSSLPDDLFQDTNGSLDQQMNVGVPQDLGPVPDKSGINEVINERLDEHMGADVTQAEKQEPALSPIPEDSLIDVDASDGIKTVKKMIGPDGSELQLEPWVEQLTRPQGSPEGVVNQHPEITLLLRSRKDMKFQLPWVNGDFYNKFWIGLAGKDRNRRGWLSDWHIDVWFQYIWHFRQKDADWVMVGPYFNAQILYRDVPFYYADGVTYGVPWTDESVEKVYFPINEPKVHWALGVLHIRSGLVTIYDSLHGPDAEGKVWWANWMEHFAAVIPPYLEEANVMAKKKIDPKSYSITFTYNKEVPMQVGYYGDCGIWVMIFLYRLTHNIPLMVDDAAAVAIAYREQLMAFFWKYKKVIAME